MGASRPPYPLEHQHNSTLRSPEFSAYPTRAHPTIVFCTPAQVAVAFGAADIIMEDPTPAASVPHKRPLEVDAETPISTPTKSIRSEASTPLSVLSHVQTPSPFKNTTPHTTAPDSNSASVIGNATPTPNTSASSNPQQPVKRRRFTEKEKEDQRLEKEAKAKARDEKRAQKEAEEKLRAEQKAQKEEEKRLKEEEKQKIQKERDEKRRQKEEEQQQKEEEKAKKERVSILDPIVTLSCR